MIKDSRDARISTKGSALLIPRVCRDAKDASSDPRDNSDHKDAGDSSMEELSSHYKTSETDACRGCFPLLSGMLGIGWHIKNIDERGCWVIREMCNIAESMPATLSGMLQTS